MAPWSGRDPPRRASAPSGRIPWPMPAVGTPTVTRATPGARARSRRPTPRRARWCTPVSIIARLTCVFAVAPLMTSRAAISSFERPSPTARRPRASRSVRARRGGGGSQAPSPTRELFLTRRVIRGERAHHRRRRCGGAQQLGGLGVLHEKAVHARADGFEHVLVEVERREDHDVDAVENASRRRCARWPRVRPSPACGCPSARRSARARGRARRPAHRRLPRRPRRCRAGRRAGAKAGPHERLIVGEDDRDHRVSRVGTGRWATTRKPPAPRSPRRCRRARPPVRAYRRCRCRA